MATQITAIQVDYDVTEAAITERRTRYAALTAETPKGYEEVRLAIGDLRDTRVAIEARRKELKADSLDYGRRVDAVAKFLTAKLEEIEQPLKALKAAVDEQKEQAKRSEQEAKLKAFQAQLLADQAADQERQRVAREQEAARIRAEDERLAGERAALAAERAAHEKRQAEAAAAQRAEAERFAALQAAESRRISDERRAMEAERAAAEAQRREGERKERERLAAIAAQEKADSDRAAAEAAHLAELARIEAARPDIVRMQAFAERVHGLSADAPELVTAEAKAAMADTVQALCSIAHSLYLYTADGHDRPDATDENFDL